MLHYATDIVRVCSKIPFSEGLSRRESTHLICDTNQLTGFCMERTFTGLLGGIFLFCYVCIYIYILCDIYIFPWKLEILEHNCTRCYYLCSLPLLGKQTFKKVLNQKNLNFFAKPANPLSFNCRPRLLQCNRWINGVVKDDTDLLFFANFL